MNNSYADDLIDFFKVEIEMCKTELEKIKDGKSTKFDGCDCGNRDIAERLNSSYIVKCRSIIEMIEREKWL